MYLHILIIYRSRYVSFVYASRNPYTEIIQIFQSYDCPPQEPRFTKFLGTKELMAPHNQNSVVGLGMCLTKSAKEYA